MVRKSRKAVGPVAEWPLVPCNVKTTQTNNRRFCCHFFFFFFFPPDTNSMHLLWCYTRTDISLLLMLEFFFFWGGGGGGAWEKIVRIHWTYPTFCISHAVWRGQVCPRSNKGGCHFITSSFCMIQTCSRMMQPPLVDSTSCSPCVSELREEREQDHQRTQWWWEGCQFDFFLSHTSSLTSLLRGQS